MMIPGPSGAGKRVFLPGKDVWHVLKSVISALSTVCIGNPLWDWSYCSAKNFVGREKIKNINFFFKRFFLRHIVFMKNPNLIFYWKRSSRT